MRPARPYVAGAAILVLTGCGQATAVDTGDPTVPVPEGAQQAAVVRHVDGDTVVLRGRGVGPLPGDPTKVRLLLIDTPEVFGEPECFGEQASARTAELMPVGAQVRVQADRDGTDRYGRALLHIWTPNGVNVEQVLLREGYAKVLVVAPNVDYLQEFRDAEQAARQADAGLWGACG